VIEGPQIRFDDSSRYSPQILELERFDMLADTAGEGIEPSIPVSKTSVLPVTPSRKKTVRIPRSVWCTLTLDIGPWTLDRIWSGQQESNLQPCGNLPLIPSIKRLLYQLSYAPNTKRRPMSKVQGPKSAQSVRFWTLDFELWTNDWLARRGSNPHTSA
jgi:hypothetical protein